MIDLAKEGAVVLNRLGLPDQLRTRIETRSAALVRLREIERWIRKREQELETTNTKKALAWIKQMRRGVLGDGSDSR